MFSFFKSKKPSPTDSTEFEHSIPGPDTTIDRDGFTVINPLNPHHSPYQHNQYQQQGGGGASNFVYPNLGGGGGSNPLSPLRFGSGGSATPNQQPTPESPSATFHYLQGVPFKLSAELNTSDTTEVSRLQIDEILAYLTRTFELSGDYEFRLEHTLVAQ